MNDIYKIFKIIPKNSIITEADMVTAKKIYLSYHPDKYNGDKSLFAEYTVVYNILQEGYRDQIKYKTDKDQHSIKKEVDKYLEDSLRFDEDRESISHMTNESFNNMFMEKNTRKSVDTSSEWCKEDSYFEAINNIEDTNEGINKAFNNLRNNYHKKPKVTYDIVAFNPKTTDRYASLQSVYQDNIFLNHEIFDDASSNLQLERIDNYKSFEITYQESIKDNLESIQFKKMRKDLEKYNKDCSNDDCDLNKYLL
jgi:hypothetical protein